MTESSTSSSSRPDYVPLVHPDEDMDVPQRHPEDPHQPVPPMDQHVHYPPAGAGHVNAPLAQPGDINVPGSNGYEGIEADGRGGAVNVPLANGNGAGQGGGGNVNLPPVGE